MTANERFKKRARKYAAEHNISVASATRILRERQQTAQHDAAHDGTELAGVGKLLPGIQQATSYAQALGLALSSIRPGGVDKTSATIDLGPLLNSTGATVTTIVDDDVARLDDAIEDAADDDAPPPASEGQAVGAQPSSIPPGTGGTTATALDLSSLFSNHDAPYITTAQVKGARGKTDAAELLANAFVQERGRFEPILFDTDSSAVPPQRPAARRRLAAFLIAWLVKVSGSEDPQQIATWLREHGRALDPAQQLMLEILLADPELRTGRSALASSAGDDPEQYLDNVTGLISEELAVAWPTAARYRRSYLDLDQPGPTPADFTAPPPSLFPDIPLAAGSVAAKGGHNWKSSISTPLAGLAMPVDVKELLQRKGQGNGPQAGSYGRRGQR